MMVQGRPVRAGVALLLTALLSACVLPDQLSQLQKDVADVRQQMTALRADQSTTISKVTEMEARLATGGDVGRAEFADLKAELDQVQRSVAALDERGNELQRRIDRVAQDAGRRRAPETVAPPSEPPPQTPPEPAPAGGRPEASPAPDALYNQAYADFSRGNYALAISGFEEYASRFPESPLSDNALYWIGECHFASGRFDQAIESFDKLLEKYPESDKAAAANLKKGLAYLEQNDVKLAIVQLGYVTKTYPSTDEAKIARDKLASLGANPDVRTP
jgi:tol-pal system protein YbgF